MKDQNHGPRTLLVPLIRLSLKARSPAMQYQVYSGSFALAGNVVTVQPSIRK